MGKVPIMKRARKCPICWVYFTWEKTAHWQIYCSNACQLKSITHDKDRKEHWNSSRNSEKRNEFISCIKRDVTFVASSAYVKIPERTLRDWIERDEELSQEYERAKNYMDVITSNAITNAILDKKASSWDKAKFAVERKKRRDRRYRDKQETELNWENMINIVINRSREEEEKKK